MKKTLWQLSAVVLALGAAIAAAFSVSAFTAEAVEKADERMQTRTAHLSSEESNRSEYDFNAGWKFKFGAGDGYGAGVDDTSWESVTLPHTWNAAGGTNGGYDYKRGKGISTTSLHRRMPCRRREERVNEKVLHTRMGFSSVFFCRNDSPFR